MANSALTAGFNLIKIFFKSPINATSACRFLPISAGSISAWITLAFGAKDESFPVTRSSKRAPSVINKSAFCNAVTAATVPCIPGIPRCCGCESGKAPRAINVVTTGAPVISAKIINSLAAFALMIPPPIYRTGFFDCAINAAASVIACAFGSSTGLYPARFT